MLAQCSRLRVSIMIRTCSSIESTCGFVLHDPAGRSPDQIGMNPNTILLEPQAFACPNSPVYGWTARVPIRNSTSGTKPILEALWASGFLLSEHAAASASRYQSAIHGKGQGHHRIREHRAGQSDQVQKHQRNGSSRSDKS